MQWLILLVTALVPLLITPGLLSYFDVTPKVGFLLSGAALMLLYTKTNSYNARVLFGKAGYRCFLALLGAEWLAAAVATAFSSNRAISSGGGNWRRMGLIPETGLLVFVLLAAAWLAVDRNNVRRLLRASVAAGGLGALYGIAQYFGWDPFLPPQAYQVGEGILTIVRPPGTLGHADYFAAWLVMVAFFGLALERLEPTRWAKIAAAVVPALAALAIVLSGTRAAMLGLAAGAIVFLMASRARMRNRAALVGIVCAALLAGLFFSPPGAKLRARLHWSLEDARGGARLFLWRDSLAMAAHRPLAGFGPETFAAEFPRFESIQLARAFPDFYHESPHNMFLDVLTSQGAPGLLALLGLCGLGVWAALRCYRSQQPLAAPLAAALVGALVAHQFVVFILATDLYFHLLLALLVISATTEQAIEPNTERRRAWLSLPLSWATILLLATFTVRLLIADRALAVAGEGVAAGRATDAAAAYRTVLRSKPPGAGSDLGYSRAMQQLAVSAPAPATRLLARQQALEAGVRAVSTAEDPQNAWYNLAGLVAGENDAAGTENCLRNAIALAPNWFKPHWTLAQLLEKTNRRSEAIAEARAAVERDGGHDPEVSETLSRLLADAGRP